MSNTEAAGPVHVLEYEALAQEVLPKALFDFVSGGAGSEVTLRDNLDAFTRIRIQPRVLRDLSLCKHRWDRPRASLPTSAGFLVDPRSSEGGK